jgi:hypothetical protein
MIDNGGAPIMWASPGAGGPLEHRVRVSRKAQEAA